MGIGDRLAAAQEGSSRFPSLLPSPPASSQLMGYTGMDCKTQEVGSEGLPIVTSQTSQVDCYECAAIRACLPNALLNLPAAGSHAISDACGQRCCLGKCAAWQAWSKQTLNTARLSRFLNLVRTSGNQMSPKLFSEKVLTCAAGATFTCEFLSLATCSLEKRDGNALVAGTHCFAIQIGVEINSCNCELSEPWCSCSSTWYKAWCPKKGDKTSEQNIAIGFGGKEDVDVSVFFKISFAKEKSGLMVKHEPTPSLKFDNMVKVQFLVNYRMSHKQILKFMQDDMILAANARGSSNAKKKSLTEVPSAHPLLANKFVKSDCRNDKMIFMVPSVKQPLASSKVDAKLGMFGSLPHSTKTGIPLLRAHMPCWLWVVMLTVLLSSSGAYSAKDTPRSRSEEGKCRYHLTSIAVLSCVQPDGVWRPPSQTCCNALLYAIDQVPASDVSGACCLCRFMKEKGAPAGLAMAYVICKGKDTHILTKWSSFPVTTCKVECGHGNNSSLGMGTNVHEDSSAVQAQVIDKGQKQGTGKGIWVAILVFIIIGLICFWYFWKFKVAENASEPRAGRRRSVGPSSAKRKEKRFSSS